MQLEVEKQKNAKIQKELEIARKKVGTAPMPGPMSVPGAPQKIVSKASQFIDMGDTPATSDELKHLQDQYMETSNKLDKVEKDKWEVQKKNIELKENLQRLKVQGSNLRKDIEALLEKVDRKENQNFKIRLDLTDLKKELATTKDDQEAQVKVLKKLDVQIDETTGQLNRLLEALKDEARKRDKFTLEYNKARDLLAKYEDHWLARFYNR